MVSPTGVWSLIVYAVQSGSYVLLHNPGIKGLILFVVALLVTYRCTIACSKCHAEGEDRLIKARTFGVRTVFRQESIGW